MKQMKSKYKLKVAVISGASHALEFKLKYPRATDAQVVQHITETADEILGKIDEESD